jgi:hypothetical protein
MITSMQIRSKKKDGLISVPFFPPAWFFSLIKVKRAMSKNVIPLPQWELTKVGSAGDLLQPDGRFAYINVRKGFKVVGLEFVSGETG